MIIRRDVWFSDYGYGYDYDDYLLDKYFTLTPDGKGIPIEEIMQKWKDAGGKEGTGMSARKWYDKTLGRRNKDLEEVWNGSRAGIMNKVSAKERALGRKLSPKEVVRELGDSPSNLMKKAAAAQARIDAEDAVNRKLVKDWRNKTNPVVSPKDKKEAKEAVKLLNKLKNNKAYQSISNLVKKNPYLAAGLGTGAAAAAGYGIYKYNHQD